MAHGTTYTVGPMPGDSKRWRVLANGRRVSRHNKKSTAVERARELADRTDSITVQDRNGNFQKQVHPG